MYDRCLFCRAPFGANEVLEHFPVGRRLAFDAAKGRLWAVCPSCERWNLVPLEERWEAVEDAERLYRDTPTRVSTDEIGLARVREGTELIRVGAPLRPEFAAWRYGDQFGRRRRKSLVRTAGVTVAGGALLVGATTAMVAIPAAISAIGILTSLASKMLQSANVGPMAPVRFVSDDGSVFRSSRIWVQSVELRFDSGHLVCAADIWQENTSDELFKSNQELIRLTSSGETARGNAARLLPMLNASGGALPVVRRAVDAIESAGDPDAFLPSALQDLSRRGLGYSSVLAYPHAIRLALEMALHESAEREAIDADLAPLREAWREAEAIADIADRLVLPEGVETKLDALRRSARRTD
jgi:hypothetical protein